VAGQLDDAAVVLFAIGVALRSMQPAERSAALAAVGLNAEDIDDDLATIRVAYGWMGRNGLKIGIKTTRFLAHGAQRTLGGIGRRLRQGNTQT
jgi:hypothetical protein